ncbi:hypothetical protein [Methylomarinum vadi]|uniref:hypothetical protein n=1 Tax=Methylomarinum vadi TaxID=438855 RepID=UPI0012695686|nr:hypothetical protein [Methylomarinum vadi]
MSTTDLDEVNCRLDDVESWLYPALIALGEAVSTIDSDEIEKANMQRIGYLISTLTELTYRVKGLKNRIDERIAIANYTEQNKQENA